MAAEAAPPLDLGPLPGALLAPAAEPCTLQVELCLDQPDRLRETGLPPAEAIAGLLEHCNRSESKEQKRLIFKQPRCRRCSQASTGGKKVRCSVPVRADHAQWLNRVVELSGHPNVGKTLRILIDWYSLFGDSAGTTIGDAVHKGLAILRARLPAQTPCDIPLPPVAPDALPSTPPAKRRRLQPDAHADEEEEEEEENLFAGTQGRPAPRLLALRAAEFRLLQDRAERAGSASHHLELEGRAVVILLHGGRLVCADAYCPHQGEPLGDIEDMGGAAVLRCRRHGQVFCLSNGARIDCVPPEPHRLRLHSPHVDARSGDLYVALSTDKAAYSSDSWALADASQAQPADRSPGCSQTFYSSPAGQRLLERRKSAARRQLLSLSQEQREGDPALPSEAATAAP